MKLMKLLTLPLLLISFGSRFLIGHIGYYENYPDDIVLIGFTSALPLCMIFAGLLIIYFELRKKYG